MTEQEAIVRWRASAEDVLDRIRYVAEHAEEQKLHDRVDGLWSPAEVLDHLVQSHAPYLAEMASALPTAPQTPVGAPVKYSWLGGFIVSNAGPKGNVPAPRNLYPRPGVRFEAGLDVWVKQQQELLQLLDAAPSKHLSAVKIRNPFLKFLRMKLVDGFGIIEQHNERHVQQIESRAGVRRP